MKRFAVMSLLASALLMLSVASVRAGELGSGWNRSGLYVGALAGYSAADLKSALEDSGTFKLSDGKLFGGGMAGYNFRASPDLMWGIEVDYMFLDVKGSRTDDGVTITASSNYLSSIRARVGVPLGPALIYATGGVAFTNQKLFGEVCGDGCTSVSKSDTLVGAAVGAGIEAELTKSLFLRVEGLHYWFPDKNTMALDEATLKSGQSQTVGRIGVGFKLN